MSNIKQKFAIRGDMVATFRHQEGSVVDKLPVDFYELDYHPMMGFYLTRRLNPLALPSKVYGTASARVQRIWDSYQKQDSIFSVGLFGEKGAGKSLLAALMADKCLKEDIPVIEVSQKFSTDPECLSFIESLGECFIIFDEFLKKLGEVKEGEADDIRLDDNGTSSTVARREQNKLLTFFQGSSSNRRLMFLIDNSDYMLSEFFNNRPGRMHYKFKYTHIEEQLIREYSADAGLSEEQINLLVTYCMKNKITFDMMQAIVKEWINYPQDRLEQITDILNVPAIYSSKVTNYLVKEFYKNEDKTNLMPILANEMVKSTAGSGVTVGFKKPNPIYGTNWTYEEFYKYERNSEELSPEARNYVNSSSYSTYKEEKDLPEIVQNICYGASNLMNIRAGIYTYHSSEYTLRVEKLEDEDVFASDHWDLF